MAIGGAVFWRALQPRTIKCERCGLYYRKKLEKCSNCGDLDERGVQQLIKKMEIEYQGNASLGRLFLLGSVIIGMLMILLFLR